MDFVEFVCGFLVDFVCGFVCGFCLWISCGFRLWILFVGLFVVLLSVDLVCGFLLDFFVDMFVDFLWNFAGFIVDLFVDLFVDFSRTAVLSDFANRENPLAPKQKSNYFKCNNSPAPTTKFTVKSPPSPPPFFRKR